MPTPKSDMQLNEKKILQLGLSLLAVFVFAVAFLLFKRGKTELAIWGIEYVDKNKDGFLDTSQNVNLTEFAQNLYNSISPLGYRGLNALLLRMRNMPDETLRILMDIWQEKHAQSGLIIAIGDLASAIEQESGVFTALDTQLQNEIVLRLRTL